MSTWGCGQGEHMGVWPCGCGFKERTKFGTRYDVFLKTPMQSGAPIQEVLHSYGVLFKAIVRHESQKV